MLNKNIVSSRLISHLGEMTCFNVASQRSKVQPPPPTENIYGTEDGCVNFEIGYCIIRYEVSNKLLECTYFDVSRNIFSYDFLHVFKLVKILHLSILKKHIEQDHLLCFHYKMRKQKSSMSYSEAATQRCS